jgi:hypothetical protein
MAHLPSSCFERGCKKALCVRAGVDDHLVVGQSSADAAKAGVVVCLGKRGEEALIMFVRKQFGQVRIGVGRLAA